jgi:hypothetical protein
VTIPHITNFDAATERHSRRSQRALLQAERVTQDDLDAAAKRATDTVLLTVMALGMAAPHSRKIAAINAASRAGDGLRIDSAGAVLQGRQAARAGALARVTDELTEASRMLQNDAFEPPPASDAAEDGPLAQATGEALAAPWRAGVTAAVLAWADKPDGSLAERVREVTRANAFRRYRTAVTEVSRAFNDEHLEAADWLADAKAEAFGRNLLRQQRLQAAFAGDANVPPWALPWVGKIVKVWNSVLDLKACAFCRSMHGAITLIGRPYPNGYEPGSPHPHCRCMDMLVVLTPQRIQENEKRASLKTTAAVKFEQKLPQSARYDAAKKALVRLKTR